MTERRKGHWPGCHCIECVSFNATCQCHGLSFTTYPSYRRHLNAQVRRQKRGPKDPLHVSIVPSGEDYLKKVVANKANLYKYNLSVMSRFCAALNEGSRVSRFARSHRNLLKEVQESQDQLFPFQVKLTNSNAETLLLLAQTINTIPSAVASLLISYGLEYLSKELRQNAIAPPIASPNIKKALIKERPSAAEQFLQEETDYTEKEIQHVEYHKPTSMAQKVRAFPSSTGESRV